MYIMTEDGWRPLVSFLDVWDARRERVAEAKERVDEFQSQHSMYEIADSSSLNGALNSRYNELSNALDGLIGG